MKKKNIKSKGISVLRIVLISGWVFLCVAILLSYLFNELAWIDGETYTIYFLKMFIISFPSGIIAGTLCEFVFTGFSVFGREGTVILIWLSMVISGAWQWFFLVPAVFKWVKNKWISR